MIQVNIKYFRFFTIILLLFLFSCERKNNKKYYYHHYEKHKHSEIAYQHEWCKKHNGIEEYENSDFTRVDCLTDKNAVELDFAEKWAESIGQALHYQRLTGKKAKVVLILEKPKKQMVYFYRVKELAKLYNFDVEYITTDILQTINEKCNYKDCKCHK